jgi:ribosomal protein L35
MKIKIKKALLKRFKITKNGKILRRLSGQNHYRAKKTGERRRKGRKWIPLAKSEVKKIKRYLQI